MDKYTATEQAFKHGYEKGYEAGKPKWIPVSERLPDKSDWYLVVNGYGNISTLPYSVQNKAFNSFDDLAPISVILCSHWMPLPEPPKEG